MEKDIQKIIGNEQGADKIMVWMGLTGEDLILGPYFIEGGMDTREYIRIVRYNVSLRYKSKRGLVAARWSFKSHQQSIDQISPGSVSWQAD